MEIGRIKITHQQLHPAKYLIVAYEYKFDLAAATMFIAIIIIVGQPQEPYITHRGRLQLIAFIGRECFWCNY